MNKKMSLLVLLAFHVVFQSLAQSFVLQETNIKKNLSQCIYEAKKCHLVLLKKQSSASLAFSPKAALPNPAIMGLSEKFSTFFPKESANSDGPFIEKTFGDAPRDEYVKLTYGFLPPGKSETTNYSQLIVFIDNSGPNPKIKDMQVKNKVDLGLLALTERDKLKFKPELEPKVAEKPAIKPATKSETKPVAKPATKSSTKAAAKQTTTPSKPATKPAVKPATNPATKPATKPAAKQATKPASNPATKPTEKKKTQQ